MSKFKVALVGIDAPCIPDAVREQLEEKDIEFVAHECTTREDLTQWAADAEVIWLFGGNKCLQGNLDVLDSCGAILRTGSGTDNVPVAEATERGIVVANTPAAICDTVAEHAIGLLLAVIRQIPIQDRRVREGVWDAHQHWPGWHLSGQTLGLVGFGHISRRVVYKLRGFDLRVLAFDPYVDAGEMKESSVEKADLDEVLSQADFLTIHTPLNDGTRRLIGKRELGLMKSTAVLINTARGPIVDETALHRSLVDGTIAAAGLDVLEKEPPDPDNPLLALSNVVITPHSAPYSDVYYDTLWKFSVESVIDFAQGRWPRSYVNPGVNPRWRLS